MAVSAVVVLILVACPCVSADEESPTRSETYTLHLAVMRLLDDEPGPQIVWAEMRSIPLDGGFDFATTVGVPPGRFLDPCRPRDRWALTNQEVFEGHHISFELPGAGNVPEPQGGPYELRLAGGVLVREAESGVECVVEGVASAPEGYMVSPFDGQDRPDAKFVLGGGVGRLFGARVSHTTGHEPSGYRGGHRTLANAEVWIVGALFRGVENAGPRTPRDWRSAFARDVNDLAGAAEAARAVSVEEAHAFLARAKQALEALEGLAWLLASPELAPALTALDPWLEATGQKKVRSDLTALRLLCSDVAAWDCAPWFSSHWVEDSGFWRRVALSTEGELRTRALLDLPLDAESEYSVQWLWHRANDPLRRAVAAGRLPAPAWLSALEQARRANETIALVCAGIGLGLALLLLVGIHAEARRGVTPWFAPLLIGLLLCTVRWEYGIRRVHVEIPALVLLATSAYMLWRRANVKPFAPWLFGGALALSVAALVAPPGASWPALGSSVCVAVGVAFLVQLSLHAGRAWAWPEWSTVAVGLLCYTSPVILKTCAGSLPGLLHLPPLCILLWVVLVVLRRSSSERARAKENEGSGPRPAEVTVDTATQEADGDAHRS